MRARDLAQSDTERPFVFTERKRVAMPLFVLLGILSVTATVALAYAKLQQADDKQTARTADEAKRVDDHEARLRQIEAMTSRIDANLQQMREWMEYDRRRRPGGTTP